MAGLLDILARNQLRQRLENGLLTSQTNYADLPPAAARPEPGMNWLQSASLATLPVPGVSDVLGLLGDAQMFYQRPETRTPANFALAALPAVPAAGGLLAMMSRRIDPQNVGLLARAMPGQAGMTGYHGSPHDFDAFDISKIGTGEGAQAYGHGLYFAENPATAKQYRANRAYVGRAMSGAPSGQDFGPDWIAQTAMDEAGSADGAVDALRKTLAANKSTNSRQIEANAEVEEAIKRIQSGAISASGRLYTVDIPDDAIDKMLDWDKPLSEQPEAVRKALASLGIKDGESAEEIAGRMRGYGMSAADAAEYGAKNAYTNTGALAYAELGRNAEASKKLLSLGIPGIKYLDAGSRGAGEGTRNFVVFDDKLVKILKKE